MGKLLYAPICSLDGFVEDATGSFAWAAPDEEVHQFANDLERGIGTQLYGRGMYETMRFWQDPPADLTPVSAEYAEVWQAAHKVVFSRTLEAVDTPRTELVREFTADVVQELKAATTGDLSVGGAGLAAEALRAGLVDELHLIAVPVVVGSGKPALPPDLRLELELLDLRRFGNGTVCLSYGLSQTSV